MAPVSSLCEEGVWLVAGKGRQSARLKVSYFDNKNITSLKRYISSSFSKLYYRLTLAFLIREKGKEDQKEGASLESARGANFRG